MTYPLGIFRLLSVYMLVSETMPTVIIAIIIILYSSLFTVNGSKKTIEVRTLTT